MQSDFSVACKHARDLISVPAVPLATIRNAASYPTFGRSTRPGKGLVAALLVFCSIAAIAAGAAVWKGQHVSFDRSGAIQLSGDQMVWTKNPSIDDLRIAIRQAHFPVVLPAGLPMGSTLVALSAGSDALLLRYDLPGAWRRADHILGIVLSKQMLSIDSATPERGKYVLRFVGPTGRERDHWIVGNETVTILQSTLTPVELAHIKSAMIAQSQRQ